MEKAKFISKYRHRYFSEDITEMTYEYKGHEYLVYINHNKGNEPLHCQHENAQARIDTLVELEKMEKRKNRKNEMPVSDVLERLLEYWDN